MDHAFSSSIVHLDRRRDSPMADQSVHPNGKFHQVDLERSRRHWRGVVAPQCIWITPLNLPSARRIATPEGTADGRSTGRMPESRIGPAPHAECGGRMSALHMEKKC